MDVIAKEMPTKLKRISVPLDEEAYARLEELAVQTQRSVANLAAVLIESGLFPAGRVRTPQKKEARGGRRAGAGRPKSTSIENG